MPNHVRSDRNHHAGERCLRCGKYNGRHVLGCKDWKPDPSFKELIGKIVDGGDKLPVTLF